MSSGKRLRSDMIIGLYSVYCVVVADEEMEAERQSLYKAIGYAQGKAIEPFSKEVRVKCFATFGSMNNCMKI